jgi:hypothetical protein
VPGWLTQALIKGLSQARALGSLAPLQRLLAPLQTLEDQLGMTRGLAFLARTKGWQDLQEGAALAQAFGRDAPVILRLGGGGVLDASRQLPRLGVADVTAASLFGPPGVRLLVDLGPVRFAQWAARLSKIGYRQPWLRQWLEACSRVPVLWLGVLAVVGCILALPWPANWRELVIRTRS